MSLELTPLPGFPGRSGPVVLCILDGVGVGPGDEGDAVWLARTPTLDALREQRPTIELAAHGVAVGLPSDSDMGNSEVGHNALGAGRVFQQGASLVDAAIASKSAFSGEVWPWLCLEGCLHLIGLVSDGNVHAHIDHLLALIRRAAVDGVPRLRVHALTDGRDVERRSALRFIGRLEVVLSELRAEGRDYAIASGGGRMGITMDRYEADWSMVKRGWDCHVHGLGRPFSSARQAIETAYADDQGVDDQYLPAFVIVDERGEAIGRIRDGDGVLFFNFRGDRAIEISRAFEGRPVPFDRGEAPRVRFAGMMQYDGDTLVPERFLVAPPAIDRTVGEHLVANGLRTFAVSETQKFGHVTFFFNGNRSGLLDESLEEYLCVPSLDLTFDKAPAMSAEGVTDAAVDAIRSGRFDHVRLNLANGDMVGHTGDLQATMEALEVIDACVARLVEAVEDVGGVMLVTADHGNADEMLQRDKRTGGFQEVEGLRVPRTSHSLNPVFCVLVDGSNAWALTHPEGASLGNMGATLLSLLGLSPPADYLPSLVRPRS